MWLSPGLGAGEILSANTAIKKAIFQTNIAKFFCVLLSSSIGEEERGCQLCNVI